MQHTYILRMHATRMERSNPYAPEWRKEKGAKGPWQPRFYGGKCGKQSTGPILHGADAFSRGVDPALGALQLLEAVARGVSRIFRRLFVLASSKALLVLALAESLLSSGLERCSSTLSISASRGLVATSPKAVYNARHTAAIRRPRRTECTP